MLNTRRLADLFRRHRALRRRINKALTWLVVAQLIAMPSLALADGTWQGTGADGQWTTSGNWVGGTIPGATSGTTNADVATFNTNPTQTTVSIDSGRNLASLTFDTNAGAFTIGGAGANGGNSLLLSSGGTLQITSGFTGASTTQLFNAPLVLEPTGPSGTGSYTFANNSPVASNVLSFAGNISGGTTSAAGGVTLNLAGTGTGVNTIGGAISDGGATNGLGLAVSSGTWNVTSGSNSFSGGVLVSGGTLVTNGDNNLSSGPLTISTGGDWTSNGNSGHAIVANGGTWSPQGDFVFTGTVTGGGGLTINSGDLLPSPSSPTNIGTLTITGSGTRVVTGLVGPSGNNNFLANNTVNVVNGGNLDIGSQGNLTLTNPMSFASGTSFGERGTNVTVNTSNVSFPTAGIMTFQNDDTGNAGLMTVNGNWPTLTGALTIQVGTGGNPGALELTGDISGGFGLTKTGANTLILGGNNSFSGGLTVAQGTVAASTFNNASTSGPLGSTSVTLGSSGNTGTLEYTGTDATPSTNMPFSLATGGTGAFQVDNPGTNLNLTGAITGDGGLAKTGAGTLTLGNNVGFTGGVNIAAGTLVLNPATDLTMGNNISGAGSFVKAGAAALTLSGNNDGLTGGLSVTGGTLITSNGVNLGNGANTFTISNGAAWDFSGSYSQNVVLGTGGAVFNGSGDIGFTGTITGGTGLTFNSGDLLTSPSGPNDIGTLTIAGGRILMTGGGGNFLANNATVFVNGGLGLDFGQGGTLSLNNTMTFASGSGLGERNGTNVTLGSNVTLPSSGTFFLSNDDTNGGGFITLNNNWALTGDMALTLGSLGNTNGSAAINGVISGSSNLTVSAVNPGGSNTLVLGGANTLSGTTTINSGAVQLANASALLYSPVVVNANNGLGFAATGNYTIASLSGTGGFAIPNGVTLTVGNGSTAYNTNYSGNLNGGGTLEQAGPGTLTLSGNNNGLSGGMALSGGTLVTTGGNNLNGGGSFTISNGAAWDFSGSYSQNVVLGTGGAVFNGSGDIGFTGTITGGTGLTFNSGDLLTSPSGPNDIGTLTIAAGRILMTGGGGNFLANNATVFVNGGLGLDFGQGGTLSLNNTMTFASGSGLGERNGTNVTLGSNVTLPSSGTFFLSNDDTNGGGFITLNNNWALTGDMALTLGSLGNTNGSAAINGVISGSSNLTVSAVNPGGSNTLVLGGANTLSGTTTINSGAVQLANASALLYSPVVVNANNGLGFAATGNYTIASLSGTGGFAIPTGVTLTVGNGSTTYNTNYSGNLSGGGSLGQAGPGTLTLSGNNSGLSGDVSITGGTLATTNGNALGTGTLNISNDAIWQPTGSATYANNIVLGTGGGTLNGVVFNGGWDMGLSGTVTGGTGLNVTGGDILPTSNAASDIGTLTISNAGTRVLMFGSGFLANNSMFNVNSGGTLDFGMGGTQTPGNTMTFASGSGLGQRGTTLNLGSNVTFPSAGTFALQNDDVGGSNLITMNGNWPLTGNLALTLGSTTTTVGNVLVNGIISGSGGLTIATANPNGTNTLILASPNTFTGTTTINSGFVQLNDFLALQNSTVSIGVTNGLTFANSGAYTLGGLAGSHDEALTNVTALAVGNNSTLATNNTYSGVLSGSASYTEVGLGTQTLSGMNTYTGATTVSGGTLIAGNNVPSSGAGAFGNASTAITLGDTNTTANNWSPSLMIGGAFTVARAITIANQATSGTYTIGGSTDNNATFSGPITLDHSLAISQVANTGSNALSITGGISAGINAAEIVTFAGPGNINVGTTPISDGAGTVAVSVTGGTVVLSGANTYSGGTSVSAGTLNVNNTTGSGTGSGPVSVTGTGTLAGSGSIMGAVNVGGGTINPGAVNGTSILSVSSLTMDSSAHFAVNIAAGASGGPVVGVNYDSVYITASTSGVQAALGSAMLVLNDSSYNGVNGQNFDILHFTTLNGPTFSGNFYNGATELFNFQKFTDSNGRSYEIRYGGVPGFGNDVVLTTVPEPGSLVLCALGALGLLGLVRRRPGLKRPENNRPLG